MKILPVALLPLLVAACTSEQTKAPPATAGAGRTSTASAILVHGDFAPGTLVHVAVPKPTETALLGGSNALAPKKPFTMESLPVQSPQRDFRRVMQGTDPAAFTFPLDAPVGARVIVRAVDPSISLATVHMHSVATGQRLDLARDASSTAQVGVQRPPSGASATDWPTKMNAPAWNEQQAAKNEPIAATPVPTRQREPGLTSFAQNTRVIAVDVPTTPGLVQLDLPPDVAASGVLVEVQEPNSDIGLQGAPGELNYALGESAQLTLSLASGSTPITGATITAQAELPSHQATTLTFTSAGNGLYTATVPLSDASNVGVWSIHAKAAGTVGGVAFERDVETAFGFYAAHARMTAIGTPQVTRGADGLVDEVSVDVDVQTLEDDRFSVRGTLTYTGSDGQEHPLAEAQTGQTLSAGTGTITLHFSATSLALARVSGPFHLRDAALVSQGYVVTQHRLGRGLELATEPLAAKELRFPTVIPIQAQDLIDNGDLPPVTTL
jgi:hypothetical protein